MNKKELVRKLIAAQQTLLDSAKAAEREMTDEEKKSFDDFQTQIDALNAQLADANAENARLKNLLANQKPAPAPAPQPSTPADTTPTPAPADTTPAPQPQKATEAKPDFKRNNEFRLKT